MTASAKFASLSPSVRALNAHIEACAGDDAPAVMEARAERRSRSQQSAAAAAASGNDLEGWLDDQHEAARALRLADLEHQNPAVRVLRHLDAARFEGQWRARSGPDYRGTLRGGRSVTVEAKNAGRDRLKLVDDGSPHYDGVKQHQADALNRALALGGVALLVVRFRRRAQGRDVETTYAVPWDAVCGMASIGPDDVRPWACSPRGVYLERWTER